MDSSKCNYPKCNDPGEIGCQIPGCDFQDCIHWQKTNQVSVDSQKDLEDNEGGKVFTKKEIDTATVNWTGNSMGLDNLWLIKNRSVPIIIGVLGLFNSGKTTFLSMLYLLVASGKRIGDFRFSGSYTLAGWENISYSMRWNKTGQFSFPAHTSADIGRNSGYLHLVLKKNDITRDIIFTDVPGEWFAKWSENIEQKEAEGASRIVNEADGFILLADCEGLNQDNPERTLIRRNTEKLAARLRDNIEARPITILWSKADTKPNIREKTLEKLEGKLKEHFPSSEFFDVSYQKNEEQHFHHNILASINWIIENLETIPRPEIKIETEGHQDYFFKYRG